MPEFDLKKLKAQVPVFYLSPDQCRSLIDEIERLRDCLRISDAFYATKDAEIERLRTQIAAISDLFPDDATHRHPETGESLLDNVRDLLDEVKRLRGVS